MLDENGKDAIYPHITENPGLVRCARFSRDIVLKRPVPIVVPKDTLFQGWSLGFGEFELLLDMQIAWYERPALKWLAVTSLIPGTQGTPLLEDHLLNNAAEKACWVKLRDREKFNVRYVPEYEVYLRHRPLQI